MRLATELKTATLLTLPFTEYYLWFKLIVSPLTPLLRQHEYNRQHKQPERNQAISKKWIIQYWRQDICV